MVNYNKTAVYNIIYIIIVCVLLLIIFICIPIRRQIASTYSVTIYDSDSNEVLQDTEVQAIGEYTHYLLNINSHCRFAGDLVINLNSEGEKRYESVIADLHNGDGIIRYFEENGDMNIIGNFTKTHNPVKKGKIRLSQSYGNSILCYSIN